MLIVLKNNASENEIENVVQKIRSLDLTPHISKGQERTIITVIGDEDKIREQPLVIMPGVDYVKPIMKPYKLVSRDAHPDRTVVKVRDVEIGGSSLVIVAGPCSVEGEKEVIEHAKMVKKAGATIFRAGAFKPRTSPYSFQGLQNEGLELLVGAGKKSGIPVITEIMNQTQLPLMDDVDIIQIGARNMQNFDLLKEVGKCRKPVLLKRGLANTIEEFLMSAEYILSAGNENVILCERGIRTFETMTRNTLDLSCIPLLKERTHLPVIVDPSHAAGIRSLVEPLSKAAIAVGADGLMIEVNLDPVNALCDGEQSLSLEEFDLLMPELKQRISFERKILA